MLDRLSLTTANVLEAFSQELDVHGGRVADTFDDGSRLFVRGLLPDVQDVQEGDKLQGGVALRATDQAIWLHPYVYRLVCKNGAIMAQATQSRQITGMEFATGDLALEQVRQAVGECCEPSVFSNALGQIRTTADMEADGAIAMMSMLSRLPQSVREDFLPMILKRFFEGGDRSQFGVMNAVTAVARDTADPQIRWNLEELGGGIAILAGKRGPRPRSWAARARYEEVLVH
jgi:hypothetical protein